MILSNVFAGCPGLVLPTLAPWNECMVLANASISGIYVLSHAELLVHLPFTIDMHTHVFLSILLLPSSVSSCSYMLGPQYCGKSTRTYTGCLSVASPAACGPSF